LEAGKKPQVTGQLPVDEVDLTQWTDFRIVAQGNVLQHFVNGKLAAEITDLDESKRSMKGVIGLQLHAGPPMKVEFKDIVLKRTAKPKAKQQTHTRGGITMPEGF